jgi:hypothetical protein
MIRLVFVSLFEIKQAHYITQKILQKISVDYQWFAINLTAMGCNSAESFVRKCK